MENTTRKIFSVLPVIAMALCLAGCQEEIDPGSGTGSSSDGGTIALKIGGDESATKSSISSASKVLEPIDISEESGIRNLIITEEVSSLDKVSAPATKGTPIFTENLATYYSDGLAVTAYSTSGTLWGNKDVVYKNQEGNIWSHNYTEDGNLRWPDDKKLKLFIKAPLDDAGRSNIIYNVADDKIDFDYASPYTADSRDAEVQEDILFSSKSVEYSEAAKENKVLLYHALTGVKFKLAAAKSKNIAITSIDKVELTGVISEGHCTISPASAYEGYTTPSNSDNKYPTSAIVSKWTYDEAARASFSQVFTEKEAKGENTITDDKLYPEAFNNSSANAAGNINATDCSKTFMFIPQAMSDDVVLTISFHYTQGGIEAKSTATVEFGKKLKASNPDYAWKAGELRTYTLSVGDRLDVSIDDEMTIGENIHKKNNLSIVNTGTATAYMRVCAFANWFYNKHEGEIIPEAITPCTQFDDFFATKINSTDWFLCSDGFYYYKHPVAGNTEIPNSKTLFVGELDFDGESGIYKYKPYNDCHLEVEFAVQSVRVLDVANAWPSEACAKFDKDVTTMN